MERNQSSFISNFVWKFKQYCPDASLLAVKLDGYLFFFFSCENIETLQGTAV